MEKENKMCPFLMLRDKFPFYCYEESCAWYDTENEDCCIKVLADSLDIMTGDDGYLNTWVHDI